MSQAIAKVVPDHDGQVVLLPEGRQFWTCDELSVEVQGDAVILRPVRKGPSKRDADRVRLAG